MLCRQRTHTIPSPRRKYHICSLPTQHLYPHTPICGGLAKGLSHTGGGLLPSRPSSQTGLTLCICHYGLMTHRIGCLDPIPYPPLHLFNIRPDPPHVVKHGASPVRMEASHKIYPGVPKQTTRIIATFPRSPPTITARPPTQSQALLPY